MMDAAAETTLEKIGGAWVVRLLTPGRPKQEFVCASEAMARQLLAALGKRPAPAKLRANP